MVLIAVFSISSCFISNANCNDIPLSENFDLTSTSLGLDRFDFSGNIFMKIEGVDYAGNVIEFSIVSYSPAIVGALHSSVV